MEAYVHQKSVHSLWQCDQLHHNDNSDPLPPCSHEQNDQGGCICNIFLWKVETVMPTQYFVMKPPLKSDNAV